MSPFFLSSETTLAFPGSHQHICSPSRLCHLCPSQRRWCQQLSCRSSTVRVCTCTSLYVKGTPAFRGLSTCALLRACYGRCFAQIFLRKEGLMLEQGRFWQMEDEGSRWKQFPRLLYVNTEQSRSCAQACVIEDEEAVLKKVRSDMKQRWETAYSFVLVAL